MATFLPFAALRPAPSLAQRVCELPYDVMTSEEARGMADGNPLSFLHVSKAEINFPPGRDAYSAEVYASGRDYLHRLIAQGALRQDESDGYYLYRLTMGAHTQVGIVGVASSEEYNRGVVKKHELTRPDKEQDRVNHIDALNSQTGPVFLVHRASHRIATVVSAVLQKTPDIDFVAVDGVRHSAWVMADAATIDILRSEFAQQSCLYIADGHHRCAAAARVAAARQGRGESGRFLAVSFAHDQVQILPYNRVLVDLNGHRLEDLAAGWQPFAEAGPGDLDVPRAAHEVCWYAGGRWRSFRFRASALSGLSATERLDVSLLQRLVLEPTFGIADPRTSQRIAFVGGIRGAAELVRLVDSGEYACAFSLFPTRVDDLMAVADSNGIMPPKSTWFEPKLRDGMFCHML